MPTKAFATAGVSGRWPELMPIQLSDLPAETRRRLAASGVLGDVPIRQGGDNKHHARRVVLDGHVFQSQLEADYYSQAKILYPDLRVHPSVVLVGGIRYKPDFGFTDRGRYVYVETKYDGTAGGRFPTVKKLWRVSGPGVLRIIYRGPRGTFITKQEIHPIHGGAE